jgi:hypothetical protein
MTNSVDVQSSISTVHVKRLTATARLHRSSSIAHSRGSVSVAINLLLVIKCYINTDNLFLGIKYRKFYVDTTHLQFNFIL